MSCGLCIEHMFNIDFVDQRYQARCALSRWKCKSQRRPTKKCKAIFPTHWNSFGCKTVEWFHIVVAHKVLSSLGIQSIHLEFNFRLVADYSEVSWLTHLMLFVLSTATIASTMLLMQMGIVELSWAFIPTFFLLSENPNFLFFLFSVISEPNWKQFGGHCNFIYRSVLVVGICFHCVHFGSKRKQWVRRDPTWNLSTSLVSISHQNLATASISCGWCSTNRTPCRFWKYFMRPRSIQKC